MLQVLHSTTNHTHVHRNPCRTRDVLDALIVALRNLPVGIHALHADLAEDQALSTITHYRACLPNTTPSNQGTASSPAGDPAHESPQCIDGMQVLVATDAGLQVLPKQARCTVCVHHVNSHAPCRMHQWE